MHCIWTCLIRIEYEFARFAFNVLFNSHSCRQASSHLSQCKEISNNVRCLRLLGMSQHWNGTALVIPPSARRYQITSDASGSWACGAWYDNYWFSIAWTESCKHLHITVKEMAPVIIAAIIWGHDWKGGLGTVFCDNTAVVAALNNRSCKEKQVMHLLRVLFFVEAHSQFRIYPVKQIIYPEINRVYSLSCTKQHILNRLMLIPLFYSG